MSTESESHYLAFMKARSLSTAAIWGASAVMVATTGPMTSPLHYAVLLAALLSTAWIWGDQRQVPKKG